MPDFHEELERRIEQFRHYLALMPPRRAKLTKGNCYIIFEERRLDGDDNGAKHLAESKSLVYHSGIEVGGWDGSGNIDESGLIDLPDEGWRRDDSSHRFVQFSFNPRFFDMDIPNTTLFRAEAEIILQRRTGFFYVKDNPKFAYPAEDVARFDPVRKAYVHGDERIAAEDTAYVLFNVWKFPVDSRFFVTASSFHDGKRWEQGWPIE